MAGDKAEREKIQELRRKQLHDIFVRKEPEREKRNRAREAVLSEEMDGFNRLASRLAELEEKMSKNEERRMEERNKVIADCIARNDEKYNKFKEIIEHKREQE